MTRDVEIAKYRHVYSVMDNYRMGDARRRDAIDDLQWAKSQRCLTYLDIGCGRGEMLHEGRLLGMACQGTEVVPELCGGSVRQLAVHELHEIPDRQYDVVSSFDVIEHLPRGDDILLIEALARIATKCFVVTANNHTSVDPTTGNDLHINIRSYNEWHELITQCAPGWTVERCLNKAYVSETWRGYR